MRKFLASLWTLSLVCAACANSEVLPPDAGGSGGAAAEGGVGGHSAQGTGGLFGSGGSQETGGTTGTGGSGNITGTGGSGIAGSGGTVGIAGHGGSLGMAGAGGAAAGSGGGSGRGGGAGGGAGATGRGGSGGGAGTGGAPATGGAGGTGKGGNTGGSGVGGAAATGGAGGAGLGSCAAMPVSPNATAQVRNVLCYLYSQYGNHILSGQEESGAEVEIDYIHTTTGKYPAIRSFEANGDGAATRCVSYWNAGGLCMFGYHMGAPSTADGYTGSMTAVTGGIDSVLTVGSANNTVFNQRLDALANRLLTVQAAGGVVIFRPFHEAGGTWFWWSMEGGAQYVRLWKYAFDRVTKTDGVKNAIWLLPYDGNPQASFDPGQGYRDIGGADNYNKVGDYSPMTSIYTASAKIFGTTMPIALHECGPVPDPNLLQSTKTNWLFFSIWTQPYPETYSTAAELQKVYSSTYVVSRDELPSFK